MRTDGGLEIRSGCWDTGEIVMPDQLPARAADIGNTVIHVLSGHIPSWEAIRDLVLPELQKVRQEALGDVLKMVRATNTFYEVRGILSDDQATQLTNTRVIEATDALREQIAENIRGLMEKDGDA